jgi:hypothetical protein
MDKIREIQKSWKKDGYAFVALESGKSVLRKVYEWKTGKYAGRQTLDIAANVYSFIWGSDSKGTEIKYEHNYSKKGTLESIKEEMIVKHVKIPAAVLAPIAIIEDTDDEVKHEKFLTIKTCVENNIPVYLVGPAGSGKNHTLEQIAAELELDFYFTNSIQQEYKLTGFIDAGGIFHETEFYKAFLNGGLFFLDEMDASIPEVLVLLNAAIANKYFEFPNGKITAHIDFRVVAAGNTMGNGADEQYTGRLVLDQATLDRFSIIEFDYSRKIETFLAKGNVELVEFVHMLRDQAKEKGIRATFSYRAITMVVKLEGKLTLIEILGIAVFKGMDKDTIKTFRPEGYNKYQSAMRAMP